MSKEAKRPTIGQRIKYLLLRLLGVILFILPHWASRTIARLLGVIAFDVLRMGRRMVLSYLEQVFPEKTPAQRRSIGRAGHCNLTIVGMEMLHARFLSREQVISRIQLEEESETLYHQLMKEGRGVVFVGAHYSNWELLGARLASVGYSLLTIVQDHPNPLFNRYLAETRGKLGTSIVRRSEAVRGVLRALNEGRAVGVLADQDAGPNGGVVTDFFGKPVSSFQGPFAFTVRCNAPLVAAWIYRSEGGRYRAGCQRLDEKALAGVAAGADEETRILRLTESFVQWLEELILKDPRQYLWLHPRWQTDR